MRGRFSPYLVLTSAALAAGPLTARTVWDVREFGAQGNGRALDTEAIQRTIDACGQVGGGVVRVPAGRYLTGTLELRSHVTLLLEAGARLIGTTNLDLYRHPSPPADAPEARWGRWHRGLLIGQNLENVTIRGPGTIDGNRVFDPEGEEKMRGPHALVFMNVRGLKVEDLTIQDAANYGIFFMVCDEVTIRRVHFLGGWDGVHWRGTPDRWCRRVSVLDCDFETGDDAIAGRYWEQTLIADCRINSSCNGLRLIGPARDLTVRNCHFFGPGRRPHLTSGERRRTNMLAGILLQPGAWDATRGDLDDVWLIQNTMRHVAAPVALWTRPGNRVGRVVIEQLHAVGVYRAPFSVERWGPEPIESVTLRGIRAEFTGDSDQGPAPDAVRAPGVDVRPLPAWGLYARGVQSLAMEEVRFQRGRPDHRPAVLAEDVAELTLDRLDLSDPAPGTESIRTRNCGRVIRRNMPVSLRVREGMDVVASQPVPTR